MIHSLRFSPTTLRPFMSLSNSASAGSIELKMMPWLLIIFVSAFQGVICFCTQRLEPIYVKEGEVALLKCPLGVTSSDVIVLWQRSSLDLCDLKEASNSSLGLEDLGEQNGRPVTAYREKLVMLNISRSDEGFYACSLRNGSGALRYAWFNLTVYRGKCYTEKALYSLQRSVGESATIKCPLVVDVPLHEHKISWVKDCKSEMDPSSNIYIEKLTESDAGYYTCTCSFWNGTFGIERVYNMSATVQLTLNDDTPALDPQIIQPRHNEFIAVDVGKMAVITCTAVLHNDPEFEDLFWLNGTSFVDDNSNSDVFYNSTVERQGEREWHMRASLVFKNMSQEHLNRKYTCKLESTVQKLINVSIILVKKESPGAIRSYFLWLGIVGAFVLTSSVVIVIYVKLKIDIVLFIRDLRGGPCSVSDGKQYDAYIMCYKTSSEEALSEEDRRLIHEVLETTYGYQLCIYDRDVLPGTAVADAVLENIGLSRRLVLVPSALDPEQEGQYGLMSGLHAALVDRRTQLILIERAPRGQLESLPESLQLLARSSGTVTWRDARSAHLSSAFWKKLRYHMPARKSPQHRSKEMTIL
ncbi:hypothetical protein MATL_G00179220 [Megalops atlanticus]|uniref:Uncharacterized protein n=1 Tax=Megalops atlanticus TaxID=7932 RepID=A0A9D3T0I4_MEGAT|nr:hypothetical protein MATL_G00179220 [Megalops atlanticus]